MSETSDFRDIAQSMMDIMTNLFIPMSEGFVQASNDQLENLFSLIPGIIEMVGTEDLGDRFELAAKIFVKIRLTADIARQQIENSQVNVDAHIEEWSARFGGLPE